MGDPWSRVCAWVLLGVLGGIKVRRDVGGKDRQVLVPNESVVLTVILLFPMVDKSEKSVEKGEEKGEWVLGAAWTMGAAAGKI